MLGGKILNYVDRERELSRTPLMEAFLSRLELFGNAVVALENGEENSDIIMREALGDADEQELLVLVDNANQVSLRLAELLSKYKQSNLGLD